MAQTYKTEGIILKRWDYKEQDRMVRILTRDFGKITTRAISARKITAKLAGSLEPFIHADFFIARSKTIDIVAGSNIIFGNVKLRHSLLPMACANFFGEIVDRLTPERQADKELFLYVNRVLQWLNENDPHLLAFYAAIVQLFGLVGHSLELYQCHACKKPTTEQGSKLNYQLWNIECCYCHSREDTLSLSGATIKALRFLLQQDFPQAAKLHLPQTTWEELYQALHKIMCYHFEKPLLSENLFLQALN
ncbi:MAG: DNA repair protein RecO [Candidatus Kerfeldbacteria bacterium RIFOXYA2_FULL_38_24]|uniref:DNA repair protein RecO n=1 Tax=Candidatus Kerfeldbacteria bacterium RIFOXYB2_FULL_38_14 TaxID=1798547 RepID=A0A1G2BBD7_9BACT|nr:MAG: DNA repair protein RecO [Candidatus Kerfeldbacteria bacterium RIFOXYA2_FULL_38_24]OGY86345.1 MAG: DNA repair protein RecO [Candidatus Kerfeldbacteria bacterium RIFOXYB2_FULL_38_14]OGY89858.1 MAG: DNA repair protein RecO [Candidatus Kerfeldbacteria bacterium RIFOXYC2_FULL_38_9]